MPRRVSHSTSGGSYTGGIRTHGRRDLEHNKDMQLFDRRLKQMSRAIREFGDKDLRREMTQASKEAAKVAVPYVQKYVPIGKTGNLHRNIKAAGTKTVPKVKAGTKTKGGPYAWLVHHGHVNNSGTLVKGQPYMTKGISEGYPAIIKKFRTGMNKAIGTFNSRYRVSGSSGRISRYG